MKTLLFLIFTMGISVSPWEANFENAKKLAKEKNQFILLNFSGSDWCIPCIRMHKEIFTDAGFLKMADQNLVLVNADFPRNKKNQLPVDIKKQNEALADQYNPNGRFPYILLLNAEGKVIKTWEGLPDETPTQFTATVKQICNANH
ncbi:thioredoxin family protein [Pedobacter sp. SL55]|uniref:thioredoxin family protein n=1 Tax=Pedobacter sp. SL55 TaxID=2995161 RepID=UPI002271C908|nr:thioredoxin family protein [Pedobacter sp. SL55]WAC40500.1 thioredoxin family protein [Pedobacter sp. SL55]